MSANTKDPLADLPPADDPEMPDSVGSAEMDDDGTLRMSLYTETEDGMVGEMMMVVKPDDPRYAGFVAHLGGIGPGEAKVIPPFPEPEIDPKSV
jgi:hypothetical protein